MMAPRRISLPMSTAIAADDSPLIPVRLAPLNQEVALDALVDPVTPTSSLYLRTNFEVPSLDSSAHPIVIRGMNGVERSVAAAELATMPQRTIVATMECAGNGRLDMRPLPDGEPWAYGAVGTSEWTGVPLAALFDDPALVAGAVEILTTAADEGTRTDAADPARPFAFARAMPIADALRETTLLALRLNGEPIPADHGGPVRLVVPGWYGMASVKWVARIEAIAHPFDGYFQTRRYVYEDAAGLTAAVDRMRVRALITAPADRSLVTSEAPLVIEGWAWSGEAPITHVEVAVGSADAWCRATLVPNADPFAWTRWRFECGAPERGRVALRARATDAAGNVQPDVPPWNRLGYGNNAVHVLTIDVR